MTISQPDTAIYLFAVGILLGLAIGLRNPFRNWLAGIRLRPKHLRCGDIIEYGDEFAWVQKTRPMSVVLVTRDKRRCVVPNRSLFETQRQGERGAYSKREIVIRIPVADDDTDDGECNMAQITDVARMLDGLMTEAPALATVSDAGAQAIQVTTQAWIRDPDDGLANVKSGLLHEIWDRVHAVGLAIPISTASRPRLH